MFLDSVSFMKELLDELAVYREALQEPLVMEPFYKDFSYRFCWNSNSIEGNTLSLDETIEVIDFDTVRSGHTYQEYTEAKNLYRAIQEYFVLSGSKITQEWIQEVNGCILGEKPGYRKNNLYIGTMTEAVYYPPAFGQVPELMEKLMDQLSGKKDLSARPEKILELAEGHIRFERIHPFRDGNGRTGRFILNQQLINEELLPILITDQSKYRQALRRYDKNGDVSMMAYLIGNGERQSLETIKGLWKKVLETGLAK